MVCQDGKGVGFGEHEKNQEFCFGYVSFEMLIRPLCG